MGELEHAKSELLDRAAELIEAAAPDDVRGIGLERFVRRYFRHVAAEDLVGKSAQALCATALSHLELARRRTPGSPIVRIITARPPDGDPPRHSVVEVVTDDMPFLVDSLTNELSRLGRAVRDIIHPQFRVERDADGALTSATGGSLQESWIHLEIDRETSLQQVADLTESLEMVLHEVRRAVDDWQAMRDAALECVRDLEATRPLGVPPAEVDEARALIQWLADDHFTFIGARDYVIDPGGTPRPVAGSALGILRDDEWELRSFGAAPPSSDNRVLVVRKADARSPIHRPTYLDCLVVRRFNATGQATSERRFLGLLSATAYAESVQRIPLLRRKVIDVLERLEFSPVSHSGKDVLQILESYPRDELFEIPVEDLHPIVDSVVHLQERRRPRLYVRRDELGRYASCLVYLPRDRYTTEVRLRVERLLREAFRAESVEFTARVTESVLARLHFLVRVERGRMLPEVDADELEAKLVAATRRWSDDLDDALTKLVGPDDASRLLRAWPQAFPEAYKEDFPAAAGARDLVRLDRLAADKLTISLYEPYPGATGQLRLKLYRDGPLSLSGVLPMLQRMGVEVVDERPYEIERGDGRLLYVYDFGLRAEHQMATSTEAVQRFQDCFAAVWHGLAESDRFNALVLRAGLTWRQATILRAYARYLHQTGSTFSEDYVAEALLSYVDIARLLVELFEIRFDPESALDRAQAADEVAERIARALDDVPSLDQDRILRWFLGVIRATLRTNFFQPRPDGSPKSYLSLKLNPHLVPELPAPRPEFEIWVHSPEVEGVHLRFGAIARGGLRWSDRREDFRTEVLGLVKAQMVKNAVIVPVGAKGGFVVRRPRATPTDRDAVVAEGVACYKTFICGMLDITDNLVGGKVVPPPSVVRHDDDDTYLVVAADKGTATFSDIANGVAAEYDFWLGDAFASGGSVGYDHKAMGITAKGAWESVKRHFRELGRDTQTDEITVVGVGDMSGDVFGNGMLLSKTIRLVAAFDHRHVFLDPDPDAAASFAERARLFALPRSSWADYDEALLSPGGGVHPRSAKSIPVTPEVRARLGLPEGTGALSPADLISAILRAPVDLLWNGGIGTYVKASTESHADVGDKANDVLRVDGAALRCRVVGEGGNLGFTQRGRIEAARAGVRINTDALDNSAGVDCSDHEVNIKILLDTLVRDGRLSPEDRNQVLGDMTDEVAALVLHDNYEQNILLGNARAQAAEMINVHRRFLRHLEQRGELDRELEFLPTDRQLEQRQGAGEALTSPELAVLVAYSKIVLDRDILDSALPDEQWFRGALRGYFPRPLVQAYDDVLDQHPLRRAIISTCVVNDMVNRGGITFAYRAHEETGASHVEVTRAYTVAREVFEFEEFWTDVEALDNTLPTSAQSALNFEGRRLLDRSVRWLLQARRESLDVAREIGHFRPIMAELGPRVPELLRGGERVALEERAHELEQLSIPAPLALRAASMLAGYSLLDISELAVAASMPPEEVAALYFAVSERFLIDRLLTRISELARNDRWESVARSALRHDVYEVLAALTWAVLSTTTGADPDARIAAWEDRNAAQLARARAILTDIHTGDNFQLATLSVALRTIRSVLRT